MKPIRAEISDACPPMTLTRISTGLIELNGDFEDDSLRFFPDEARALGLALLVMGTEQSDEPLFGKTGPYLGRIWDALFDDADISERIKWIVEESK